MASDPKADPLQRLVEAALAVVIPLWDYGDEEAELGDAIDAYRAADPDPLAELERKEYERGVADGIAISRGTTAPEQEYAEMVEALNAMRVRQAELARKAAAWDAVEDALMEWQREMADREPFGYERPLKAAIADALGEHPDRSHDGN